MMAKSKSERPGPRRLYRHKTDGGAEYLCSSPVPGTDEGSFDSDIIIRLDGGLEIIRDNAHADLLAACEAADALARAVREHTGANRADKLTRENYALAYARVRVGGAKVAHDSREALKISEEEAWAALEKRTA